jgi:hypothetical protein
MEAGKLLRQSVSLCLRRSQLCYGGELNLVRKVTKFKSRVGQVVRQARDRKKTEGEILSHLSQ